MSVSGVSVSRTSIHAFCALSLALAAAPATSPENDAWTCVVPTTLEVSTTVAFPSAPVVPVALLRLPGPLTIVKLIVFPLSGCHVVPSLVYSSSAVNVCGVPTWFVSVSGVSVSRTSIPR